ncbi:hypothetical protein ACFWNK_02240 [Streptomyces sp. NPDC058417]|uniref:hypothetical protein n=1 Tax=unclassified Streptomyces TaxID=2593676 RepID=UPI0036583637
MPWLTLLSAVVGAVIATSSAALLDRFRWRRERHDRLLGVRRSLYGDYLACLSEARNAFRSLARDLDATATARERTARDGFAACYGARYQMSITASQEVYEASETAFRRLRDVRDLAAAGAAPDDAAYEEGRIRYEDALTGLRAAMRRDLGSDRRTPAPPAPGG